MQKEINKRKQTKENGQKRTCNKACMREKVQKGSYKSKWAKGNKKERLGSRLIGREGLDKKEYARGNENQQERKEKK